MSAPERSPERDAALDALVAANPFPGWTAAGLRTAAGPDADLLFPGGPVDMVEAWCDLADRRLAVPLDGRLPDRVRALIAGRLSADAPHREAIRRAVGVLSANPVASARILARTVDALWHAAGDRSADWSWYTKRAILAGVYGSTRLFWLRDDSEGAAATLAFLDRRLAGVGRIGRLRRRAEGTIGRFRPGQPA